MVQLYLCRHGETPWSLTGQHTGKTELSLTEEGARQAGRLRQKISSIPFSCVLVSPRLRARQSAEGLSYEEEPLLAEWDYGLYEGKTRKEILQEHPGWDLFSQGAPKGESVEEVKRRADLLLSRLASINGNVALFSHGHFLRVLAVRFLGLEVKIAKSLLLSVASLSILSFDRGTPVISLWNAS